MHVYLWLMAAPLSFTFLPAECSFSSPFFPLFSTLIHSTLSVLCLPPLSAHLWSDKSQIIWLTMQNSARCRNPPIPSSAQLANYSEELAHASLLRWGGEERDGDWWGAKRRQERERKKEKEQKERGRQRWRASAGRGGINFLDRQEQLWFTACRGMVRYKERILKQIDDSTQESSSLLQHDAGESTCASKRP